MKNNKIEKQVEEKHYNFSNYLAKPRWNSYWHQIDEVLNSYGKDLLIIGTGDNIIKKIVESDKVVKTFDIAEDLKPDYLGSILEMDKILDKKFDTILCCQVLEHLPFELFEKSIEQIAVSTKKTAIISLPHKNIKVEFKFKVPKIKIDLSFLIRKFYKIHKFDGEHYWEMGGKGFSNDKIENILEKYFVIKKRYFVDENSYHRFYILEKII
ncbi:MAG: hypothetical protein ACRC6A_01465 [Fusobacteriaceae bacterium]